LAIGFTFGNSEKFSYTPSFIYNFVTFNVVRNNEYKGFNLYSTGVFTNSFLIKNLIITEIGFEAGSISGYFFNLGVVKKDKFKILASFRPKLDPYGYRSNAEIMFNYKF
jgi:hypothetical protein